MLTMGSNGNFWIFLKMYISALNLINKMKGNHGTRLFKKHFFILYLCTKNYKDFLILLNKILNIYYTHSRERFLEICNSEHK